MRDARRFDDICLAAMRRIGAGVKPERVRIICEVTFLPLSEGGRATMPLLSGDQYRPHIVMGDQAERVAIVGRQNRGLEEYIGVAFHEAPAGVELGSSFIATLSLMYAPNPIYDRVQAGATFTIREGAKVVGYGIVLADAA